MFTRFEDEFSSLYVEEGILHFIYKPIPSLTVRIARRVVSKRLVYQQGISLPILCDTRGIASSDKAARDYLAKEGSEHAKAVAILDDRRISYTMHRFYIKKNRPIIPTEVFTDREEAICFLSHYV